MTDMIANESVQDTPMAPATLPTHIDEPAVTGGGFKLLRIFLVDSLSRGTIVKMEVEGGTVLTGGNGKGKTSLLQLLLIFYGTNPNKLTDRAKGSFINYYLPNTTSFIVYEYQVLDGSKRMVIAYSNSTGEKIFYRFVRQGYDKNLFVTEEGRIVSNADLRKRLTTMDIQHSPHQIETYSEYRSVIQYLKHPGADRKQTEKLKYLCTDYAFTRYNKSLANMDNLAFGMFSRTSNFEVLKSIVIESIYPNESSHSVGTQRSAIETWPAKYRAYVEVMNAQGQYEEALSLLELIDSDVNNLSGLREQVDLLQIDYDEKDIIEAKRLVEQQAMLQNMNDTYNDKHRELETKRVNSDVRIENMTVDVDAIDKAKGEYDALQIPEKSAEYKQKDAVEQQLSSLNARKDALTADHGPIVSRYELIKAKRMESHGQAKEAHSAQVHSLTSQSEQKIKDLTDLHQSQEDRFDGLYQDKRHHLQAAIETQINTVGGLAQNLTNPQVDPEIIKASEKTRDKLKLKRTAYDKSRDQLTDLERNTAKALSVSETMKDRVTLASQKVAAQIEKIDCIVRSNTPKPDTLLFKLREERPDWGNDIGRVIRSDILLQSDLSPTFSDNAGFYGLDLILDNLTPCPQSDPLYLEQMVEEEKHHLETLKTSKEGFEAELKSLERDYSEKKKLLSEHKSLMLTAKSDLQLAESQSEKADLALKQAKQKSLEMAQALLDEAKQRLTELREQFSVFEDKSKQEKQLRKVNYTAKEREVVQEKDSAIERLKLTLQAAEVSYLVDMKQYDTELNETLASKGMDTKALEALDHQISEVTTRLAAINGLKDILNKWINWYRTDYVKRDQIIKQLEDEQLVLAQVMEAQNEMKQGYDSTKKTLQEQITAVNEGIRSIQDNRKRALTMAEKLKGFVTPSQYTEVDPDWSIDSMSKLMATWLDQHRSNSKAHDSLVNSLKRKFEKTIHSTVFEAYDLYRQSHEANTARDYMRFFETWYTSLHEQSFDTLFNVASLFVDGMRDFHNKLKNFTTNLSRFNRDLQSHLGRSGEYFNEIRDLSIEIYSTVDEIKGWSAIKAIADADRSWTQGKRLPDAGFVSDVERLLDQWDARNGISADFKSLIGLRGNVTENGTYRKFRNSDELSNVSSNGLTYLILILLFVAFWSKIKKDSPVNLVWALDELKVISQDNIGNLMRLLRDNNITLITAFPDPDVTTLSMFRNAYTVSPDRRLISTRIKRNEEITHV